MAFRTFYLFYLLTILLLVFGLMTKDVEIIKAGWHTTIIKGMWTFFIPASIGVLVTGVIYHYWFYSGRPVRRRTVMLHLFVMTLGLLLSLNIYRLPTFLLSPDTPDIEAIGMDSLIFILPGPALLIISLIVFIVGLVNAKRTA